MATEIKFCKNCADNKITHEFQDEKYGKFIRVFNIGEKSGTSTCTIVMAVKKLRNNE